MAGDDPEHDPEHDPEPGDAVSDAEALADELEGEREAALEDELEDELADQIRDPGAALPITLAVPALVLSAAIALPLHPEGFSFAQLLHAAFLRSPLEGLVMLLGFGSPFCFGAIVLTLALAGPRVAPALGQRLLVANASLLHAQLLLVAVMLARAGQGFMPLALLGFALVSGGYFTVHHARESARGQAFDDHGVPALSGPTPRWIVRWVATVVVAVCGWIRLQMLVGVRLGWAVEVMLGACVAMAVLLMPRRG